MCEGDNGGDSAPTSLLLVNQISAVFFSCTDFWKNEEIEEL